VALAYLNSRQQAITATKKAINPMSLSLFYYLVLAAFKERSIALKC
jgi:hypothetical protein